MMGAEAPPTGQFAEAVLLDAPQRQKLLGYARSRFGITVDDAEDILQDTALELLRQRDYVRSPNGFLFAVFRARCVRFVETRRARREIFAGAYNLFEAVPHHAGPEMVDRGVALRQALGEISSTCRRLLSAYYVEGQSLRETAQDTTLTLWGVHKTINRCLRKLRECLN
ncbi:MAG: RNA polymerase sigma factor [Thermoanaerobaculia bacterium]